MAISDVPSRPTTVGWASDRFRWLRAAAIGFAVLIVLCAIWGYWFAYTHSRPVDFLSFWAAGRLALRGQAAAAYDLAAHRLVELAAVSIKGALPFPYPPPFLMLLVPFGLVSYWAALALWVAATGAIYVAATRRAAPLPYALSHPALLVNAWIGQTGFLTTGLFALGLSTIERSATLGGAVFGLLVIKPQLALLIPIALLAERNWRALAGGAVAALLLLAASTALFGADTYRAFFDLLPRQGRSIAAGEVPWNELASVYAFVRWFGLNAEVSFDAQLLAALAAAVLTWRAWALRLASRGPVLAAATLLASPYLLTYDSLLLVIPIGWFVRHRRHATGVAVVWLLCLLPIVSYSGTYRGPNTIPAAAVLCLWLLHRDELSPSVSGAHEVRNASDYVGQDVAASR